MEFMRDNNRKKVIDVFSRMFEVNYSKVKNLAYSLLKSELDAEDVAQEVFTKLWEQQSIWIDNKRELDAYILIMTKNIALNISKHQKIRLEIADKMNISVRTVEQQIYLTLIELRKVLGAFAG